MKKNKLRKRVKKFLKVNWKDLTKDAKLDLLKGGAYLLWKENKEKRKELAKGV